jgi:hypothetical protein
VWYKVHITEESERGRGSGGAAPKGITGTQFTGFTGTKVQILTEVWGGCAEGHHRYSVYWLYWYKSANTDEGHHRPTALY